LSFKKYVKIVEGLKFYLINAIFEIKSHQARCNHQSSKSFSPLKWPARIKSSL